MIERGQTSPDRIVRPVMRGPIQGQFALTPKEVSSILRRHVFLIIVLTILGFVLGVVSWFLLSMYFPKYTATTYIRVLSPIERDPMAIGGALAGKEIQYQHRLSVANLIRQQSMLSKLIDRDKIQETEWFNSFGDPRNKAVKIRKTIKDLKKHLGVAALRDAEFVQISMTCGSPEESALIVNEMVDLFISSQGGAKRGEVREKLSQLDNRRSFVEGELAAAERALREVREQFGFTDLEEHAFQHTITLRLNALDREENDLRLLIAQFQANIANLEVIAEGPINEQVENEIERDPTMISLTQQMFISKARLAALRTKFGENHRNVRELEELINDLQERRNVRKEEIGHQTRIANLKNAQDELVILRDRLEEAERQRQEALSQERRLNLAKVQYEQRLDIRDQQRDMLNSIKGHIEKLRIVVDDPETPKVVSEGLAPEPLEMSSPRWKTYFPGGTVLGFLAGIGLAFLIELLNDLLRTPKDAIRYVDVPLLGVIPDGAEDSDLRKIDLCHVVRLAPYSIVSESYRSLQINLKLSASGASAKVLLVSSSGAGDGKTSVAINLATTFAFENKKVLLIDANFWRSMLHKAFPKAGLDTKYNKDLQSDFGLSNYLKGEASSDEIIRPSGIESLHLIDSGPVPSNPTELLANRQMEKLIKELREAYDYIIVDGPPVLLVSGAKILARYVEGTILVFNANNTRRGAAQRTIREMREVNATITGCVLMAVIALKGGYFHEQFKRYEEYRVPIPVHT